MTKRAKKLSSRDLDINFHVVNSTGSALHNVRIVHVVNDKHEAAKDCENSFSFDYLPDKHYLGDYQLSTGKEHSLCVVGRWLGLGVFGGHGKDYWRIECDIDIRHYTNEPCFLEKGWYVDIEPGDKAGGVQLEFVRNGDSFGLRLHMASSVYATRDLQEKGFSAFYHLPQKALALPLKDSMSSAITRFGADLSTVMLEEAWIQKEENQRLLATRISLSMKDYEEDKTEAYNSALQWYMSGRANIGQRFGMIVSIIRTHDLAAESFDEDLLETFHNHEEIMAYLRSIDDAGKIDRIKSQTLKFLEAGTAIAAVDGLLEVLKLDLLPGPPFLFAVVGTIIGAVSAWYEENVTRPRVRADIREGLMSQLEEKQLSDLRNELRVTQAMIIALSTIITDLAQAAIDEEPAQTTTTGKLKHTA